MTAIKLLFQELGMSDNTLFAERYLALEKEQILDAWLDGSYSGSVMGGNEYYEQTYTKAKPEKS